MVRKDSVYAAHLRCSTQTKFDKFGLFRQGNFKSEGTKQVSAAQHSMIVNVANRLQLDRLPPLATQGHDFHNRNKRPYC
jgi:hypothetical protein